MTGLTMKHEETCKIGSTKQNVVRAVFSLPPLARRLCNTFNFRT